MLVTGQRQRGVTLVELMVGLVIGLLVLAGVLAVYLTTLKSSNTTIKSSRLNQEMGAILNIMANDIRRAGYWGTPNLLFPATNPFNQVNTATAVNTTALRVHATTDNGTTYVDKSAPTSTRIGSCVVFTYDSDGDGTVDNNENYGYRWNMQATDPLEMRISATTGPNSCTAGTWRAVTDTEIIEITSLQFNMTGSRCLNTAEPDDVDDPLEGAGTGNGTTDELNERDCYQDSDTDNVLDYPAATGETTVESRQVVITLTARLPDDPLIQGTMQQTVQVRNNLVRIR